MSKEPENNTKIGRPLGSANKRNQEVYYLAEKHGVNIVEIKILLTGLKLKELGYTDDQIKQLSIQELVDIQSRNASDLLPYFMGKRKPVDSNGDDANDPITAFIEALSGSK